MPTVHNCLPIFVRWIWVWFISMRQRWMQLNCSLVQFRCRRRCCCRCNHSKGNRWCAENCLWKVCRRVCAVEERTWRPLSSPMAVRNEQQNKMLILCARHAENSIKKFAQISQQNEKAATWAPVRQAFVSGCHCHVRLWPNINTYDIRTHSHSVSSNSATFVVSRFSVFFLSRLFWLRKPNLSPWLISPLNCHM